MIRGRKINCATVIVCHLPVPPSGGGDGEIRAECTGADADGSACLSLAVTTPVADVTVTLDGDETRRLRAQIDEAMRGPSRPDAAPTGDGAEVLRLREECARLRAIVAGRAVPPTDGEIAAHEAAGGSWVVTPDGWAPHYVAYGRTLRRFAEQAREPCMPAVRWRSLDATGRPCAWPVVDSGESREGEGR